MTDLSDIADVDSHRVSEHKSLLLLVRYELMAKRAEIQQRGDKSAATKQRQISKVVYALDYAISAINELQDNMKGWE